MIEILSIITTPRVRDINNMVPPPRRTCHHLFEIINKSQRGGKALLKDFDEVFFSAGQRDYQV